MGGGVRAFGLMMLRVIVEMWSWVEESRGGRQSLFLGV